MDSQNLWQIFMETGAPEMYILYSQVRKMEDVHVLDDQRLGCEGYKLQ